MSHLMRAARRSAVSLSRRSIATTPRVATSISVVPPNLDVPTEHEVELNNVGTAAISQEFKDKFYPKMGNRDIVGPGQHNYPDYADLPQFPCPALRWKENTAEVLALRDKEKGDWKTLSMDDKKDLYRASFRQTLVEMDDYGTYGRGGWKDIINWSLAQFTVCALFAIWCQFYVYEPYKKDMTREWHEKTLEHMIRQRNGLIEGLAEHWDYDKNEWKAKYKSLPTFP